MASNLKHLTRQKLIRNPQRDGMKAYVRALRKCKSPFCYTAGIWY